MIIIIHVCKSDDKKKNVNFIILSIYLVIVSFVLLIYEKNNKKLKWKISSAPILFGICLDILGSWQWRTHTH